MAVSRVTLVEAGSTFIARGQDVQDQRIRSDAKATLVADLGNALDVEPNRDAVVHPLVLSGEFTGEAEPIVQHIIDQWMWSSADERPDSLVAQMAASQEF